MAGQVFSVLEFIMEEQGAILAVTGFTALVLWVFFGASLYYSERDNPDPEMAGYYKTMPDAMWITLLNLSGESPLAMYVMAYKYIHSCIYVQNFSRAGGGQGRVGEQICLFGSGDIDVV